MDFMLHGPKRNSDAEFAAPQTQPWLALTERSTQGMLEIPTTTSYLSSYARILLPDWAATSVASVALASLVNARCRKPIQIVV